VSRIFLSHPDFDHVSGTIETVEDWSADEVFTNPVFREQSRGNAEARFILEELEADHCPIRILSRGDRVELDETTELQVLWPPTGHPFKTTNEAGLVLRLSCRGRSILFPADIQQLTERELLENAPLLKSDVLVAPHHGSAEVTTGAFVRAVDPRFIVASNDRMLSQKQRNFDALVAQ
jgi:competence protein ComEC